MAESTLTPEAQAQLAKLMTDLANNPKTRKSVVKMIKEIDPTKRFPDVEIDEINERVDREFEKRDAERTKQEVLAKQEAQRNSLKDRYDDAAITEIEKIMEQEGISNYNTAAKLYAADLKPADPTSDIKSAVFQMPKFDAKNLGNLRQDSLKRGYEVVAELQKMRNKR